MIQATSENPYYYAHAPYDLPTGERYDCSCNDPFTWCSCGDSDSTYYEPKISDLNRKERRKLKSLERKIK